jgi:hypothetical protein
LRKRLLSGSLRALRALSASGSFGSNFAIPHRREWVHYAESASKPQWPSVAYLHKPLGAVRNGGVLVLCFEKIA